MDIIQLINRQQALEVQFDEINKLYSGDEVEYNQRCEAIEKEIASIEKQICSLAESIVSDESLDYSDKVQAFADAINEAAEKGLHIDDVVFGKDSILDLATANCMFNLVNCDGEKIVIGGALTAQCKEFPWLLVTIDCDRVGGVPVWEIGHCDRPWLNQSIECAYDTNGGFQSGVLSFLKREYRRQNDFDSK